MTEPATPTSLASKLELVGDAVFTVVGAPPGFAETLGDHGDAIWQRSLLSPLDVVIAFFTSRERLSSTWAKLIEPLAPDGGIWIVWPKQASGVATDLNDDVLRALLLPTGWVDNKVCAIDDTWTALRFVLRKELRPGEKGTKRPGDKHPGEGGGRAAAGKRPREKTGRGTPDKSRKRPLGGTDRRR
jgi:hypothetical protein